MSIADAARTGDHRATLIAMRDALAASMDEAPAAVVAQIAGRLSAVLVEIAELTDTEGEANPLGQLEQRRADRLAKTDDGVPPRAPAVQRGG